jgi:hypothetical protein
MTMVEAVVVAVVPSPERRDGEENPADQHAEQVE